MRGERGRRGGREGEGEIRQRGVLMNLGPYHKFALHWQTKLI